MRHRDVTGLILAGGQSRRFGSDKARHPIGGRTMIARVYDVLSPLVPMVLVSVRDADSDYGVPAECVVDDYPGAGPLAGVHAGLARCETPWLLAVACDLPFLTPDTLDALLAAREEPEQPIVACTPEGRRQPLCALYPRSLHTVAEELLKADRLAMRHFLRASGPVREVAVPQEALRNVNFRRDLPSAEPGEGPGG